MRIGFLGLGQMGREMAGRLIDAGHELTVWNRTYSAAKIFEKRAHMAVQEAPMRGRITCGEDPRACLLLNPRLKSAGVHLNMRR